MKANRPGWTPARLREHREAHGLSLEAAGEKLREVAERNELGTLAANFQTLWSHESGAVYPSPAYRRAYCLMYQATESVLGFRRPLPGERHQSPISVLPRSTDPAIDAQTASVIEQTLVQLSARLSPPGHELDMLRQRVVDAWHRCPSPRPILILIGGHSGSGRTEFARFLADVTGWALLDKDTLTRALTERLLTTLGGDPHDRHSDLYLTEVRPLEYRCLMDAAFDNIAVGTSTILSANLVAELHDDAWLSRLTNRCAAKGVDVAAAWVTCDPDTMREYIEHRAAPRDAWKLANWDSYTAALKLNNSPGAHLTLDNTLFAAISLADQTREALKQILT